MTDTQLTPFEIQMKVLRWERGEGPRPTAAEIRKANRAAHTVDSAFAARRALYNPKSEEYKQRVREEQTTAERRRVNRRAAQSNPPSGGGAKYVTMSQMTSQSETPVDSTESIREANRRRYETQEEQKQAALVAQGKAMGERMQAEQAERARLSKEARRTLLRQGLVMEQGVPVDAQPMNTIAPTGRLTPSEYAAWQESQEAQAYTDERMRTRAAAQLDPDSTTLYDMRTQDGWLTEVRKSNRDAAERAKQHQQFLNAQDDRASEERRANRREARAAAQEADKEVLAQERKSQKMASEEGARFLNLWKSKQPERDAAAKVKYDERYAIRQAAREADRAGLWTSEENEVVAIKAPEGTTVNTFAESQQKYHLHPNRPKYGTFWRQKSIPSIGYDYDFLKKKKGWPGRDINPIEFKDGHWSDEYKYDTTVIRNSADLKKATDAQDRYQTNLSERALLIKEIASQENKVNTMTADIDEYNDTLSTYELADKIGQRNTLRRELEAKETALKVLEKDLHRDRALMHNVRDKMATFFVNDGPLTSETRALGFSLVTFLLGGVVIAKAMETAVDWQPFVSNRTKSPVVGVFG